VVTENSRHKGFSQALKKGGEEASFIRSAGEKRKGTSFSAIREILKKKD